MITHVTYVDWEQFYNNGELMIEGHSVSGRQMLDYLNSEPSSPIDVEIEDIDMSVLLNENYEVDDLAFAKDLSAIRAAKEAANGRDD